MQRRTLSNSSNDYEQSKFFMPERIMGMNRYMYVEGNPVRYGDDSGHKQSQAMTNAIIGFFAAAITGQNPMEGAMLGFGIGAEKDIVSSKMTDTKRAFGVAVGFASLAIGLYGSQAIQRAVYPVNPALGRHALAGSTMGNTFGQFITARILNAGLGFVLKKTAGDIGARLFKNNAGENLGRNAADFGGGVGTALGGIIELDVSDGPKNPKTSIIGGPMDSEMVTIKAPFPAVQIDISGGTNYAIENYIGCRYFEGETDCRTIKWKKK